LSQDLKIGQLAQRVGCHVETIRYYEREGLLPKPKRSSGNYRLYSERYVERLLFIRRCRSLGMTLKEVDRLLRLREKPEGSCNQVNWLLDAHIAAVTLRVAELQLLQKHLKKLRRLCVATRSIKDCVILSELSGVSSSSSRIPNSNVVSVGINQ
jgi:Cd(II)/Pb(II)-responsive transcriptional regulator